MAHGFASRALAGTPLPHATTHQSGGSDAIKLDDLSAPDDNTDLNASTSAHGLLKKLDNTATNFLDGTGAWDSVKDSDLSTSDITTNDASTSKHGFLKKLSNVSTEFMNGVGSWATPAGATEASQAEMEAATGSTQIVTPRRVNNHPGVVKGWINFNGTGTIAIRASHNVTSITDNGTGDYTVTWDVDFSSANYGVSALASGTGVIGCLGSASPIAAGTFNVLSLTTDFSTVDATYIFMTAFGDQ